MKTIFVGPQGIRAGWRFAIFVFLLFGFSKLFFWVLTVLFHYQEHAGWYPTDFLLDGALSFGAALLAASSLMIILLRLFGATSFEGVALHGQTLCEVAGVHRPYRSQLPTRTPSRSTHPRTRLDAENIHKLRMYRVAAFIDGLRPNVLDWETPHIPDMEWVLEFIEVFTRPGI
jgi:hypothetical protein